MRKIDILILIIGIISSAVWVIASSRDGYKATDATMTARSTSIITTIDGQVANKPPSAGDRVKAGDLLVSIRNGRFDRSRLVQFESKAAFLAAEITNIQSQQTDLAAMLAKFRNQAAAFADWNIRDHQIRNNQTMAELEIAQYEQELAIEELARATRLSKSNLLSQANLQAAQTAAYIANNKVRIIEGQLQRNNAFLGKTTRSGGFFENGDASYWAKMVDTLEIRQFDNASKLATFKLQLIQVRAQENVERQRFEASNVEIHRAPFDGMVNATFVKKGMRVNIGTNLYQILDCTQPVIIIPIPDSRVTDFSVGMNVTVYPTDTEQELTGKISYVTSGAQIGADTSLQIQQGLTLGGNRAIVALDEQLSAFSASDACEPERKATVVIHSKSWYDDVIAWTTTNWPQVAMLLTKDS